MKLEIGENYFVRTVTDYWIGRLVSVDGPHDLTLEDAAWIASTGRLSEFMAQGTAANMEVEPVGMVMCHWLAVLPWPHGLFEKVL